MSNEPAFDQAAAHRFYSVECFNRAWDLIDKAVRSPAEDEEMLRLSLASTWHWTQRPDCTSENLSVAYWQTARIHALLGQADNAKRYGRLCLEASKKVGVGRFFRGYAYEALARAAMIAGVRSDMEGYLAQARQEAAAVPDADERQLLLDDLATIRLD